MKSLTRNLSLSNREEEILLLASRGLTDRQISAELGIKAGTINTHWSRIRLKLGAATRSEAVSILLKGKAEVTQQVLEAEKQTLMEELAQRKEVETELRDSRRLLQSVLANAPIILWSTDAQGELVTIEGRALALAGAKSNAGAKQKAQVLSQIVPQEAIREALKGVEVTRVTECNGVWFETLIAPIKGAKGIVSGLIGVSTDVTTRKVAEDALMENQKFLNGILAMSPTMTHVLDIVNMRETYTSPSVETVLGYTPEEIKAMGDRVIERLTHPDERKELLSTIEKARRLKDGEIIELVHRVRDSSGNYRWFLQRSTVFRRTSSGDVECLLSVAQDVDDLKKSESA